jgi:transposase-like protein
MKMTAAQVKQARRLVLRGKSVMQVAQTFRVDYQVVYNAVSGNTWSSIHTPEPIKNGVLHDRRRRPRRTCANCGESYVRGGTTKRCGKCTTYWSRHKCERQVAYLGKWHVIPDEEISRLYVLYQRGASLNSLAEQYSFSEETLRRRFDDAGYSRRGNAGIRQRLSASLVRQARHLVHEEGARISDLAMQYGVNYQTLYTAVIGRTWRAVGGPLPQSDDEIKRPCTHCGILTGHHSGSCRYCRKGGRYVSDM